MFTICPDCNNDKLKVKALEKRMYDPSTGRTTVNEEIPMVEYHCHVCGWTILLGDPPFMPEELERERADAKAQKMTSIAEK